MNLMSLPRKIETLSLQNQMDRLFNQFLNNSWTPWSGSQLASPKVDVIKNEQEIVISAEVPGMAADEVDIEMTADHLRISGTFKQENETGEDGYFWSERHFGAFSRLIPLPAAVKEDEAKAVFKNGVITIHLPLATVNAKPASRKIPIDR